MRLDSRRATRGTALWLTLLAGGPGCFHPTDAETTGTTSGSTSTATTSSSSETSATSGPTSSGSTRAELTTEADSSGSSATTGPVCLPSECPPEKPYCVGSQCVSCVGSLECSDLGAPPDKPHCDMSSGLCVACLEDKHCPVDKKYCDTVEGICKPPCEEHAQCGIGACELDVGRCFPKDAVVRHAQAGAPGCEAAACTEDAPCCTARAALTAAQDAPYVIIRVAAGAEGEVDEGGLEIAEGADRRIALLGSGAPSMVFVDNINHGPVLFLSAPHKLFIAGVTLPGGENGAGLSCLDGTVAWIDDSTLEGFSHPLVTGAGLFTANCRMVARRVFVLRNERGAWVALSGKLELVTAIVGASTEHEVHIETGGSLRATYATIVSKKGVTDSLLYAPQGSVTIRNSALVAANDTLAVNKGNSFTLEYSVFTTPGLPLEPANEMVPSNDVSKQFLDWMGDDFHVGMGGDLLLDVALWAPGLPTFDIDGQERPLMGTMDYAGADVPGP